LLQVVSYINLLGAVSHCDGAERCCVQCRGFANRLPYRNEVAAVKRWANEYVLR
jgi:hypothetical protein